MNNLSDLTKYRGTLPYASEMFGVYSPLLGWKSARKTKRMQMAFQIAKSQFLSALVHKYKPQVKAVFNNGILEPVSFLPASISYNKVAVQSDSLLLNKIATILEAKDRLALSDWKDLLTKEALAAMLNGGDEDTVFKHIQSTHNQSISNLQSIAINQNETVEAFEKRKQGLIDQKVNNTLNDLQKESVMAGVLADLATNEMTVQLEQIFYENSEADVKKEIKLLQESLQDDFEDPFLNFDPNKDIKDVTVSPIGIVHLYRQFFFELDTFLGSPVGHVWISPGATVELMEVSSRKTTIEKSFETSFESSTKQESSSTSQDDLSNATKEDNKEDTKAGFSTTANSSYPTLSISATASLSMENTQQLSREKTQKQMRQQSNKLSTEIRQNYKSTFKTITETTDTSSKRYVLTNPSNEKLINYEMRRKMRKVGVQVQDMGSYLCWETFVDEPGKNLGLANLVHIAKPADLVPPPDQTMMPDMPETKTFDFIDKFSWLGGDKSITWEEETRVIWGETKRITIPDGYELDLSRNKPTESFLDPKPYPAYGVDQQLEHWAFRFKIDKGGQTYTVGIYVDESYSKVQFNGVEFFRNKGLNVNERHEFTVSGSIFLKVTEERKKSIADANDAKIKAGYAAAKENQRRSEEAFVQAAKDRIKLASNIKQRNFEDLREEERTIVYRKLIASLMTETNYNMPDTPENFEPRHVFSELINSVFDIDKMLYFVAPEWWKPRKHYNQAILPKESINANAAAFASNSASLNKSFKTALSMPFKQGFAVPKELRASITNWSDGENRDDNYFITEDSEPARLGSSLGWLLQLDGDKHRNTFLNAPWVKAVIPIRPGKEEAALNWLQNAGVEGVDGLGAKYQIEEEYPFIIKKLTDNQLPVNNPPTVGDAINALCIEVKEKNKASMKVDTFPKDPDIHDDQKVSSTPIEKVFEHGFYPLQGGFRANPNPDNNEDPNNKEKYFNIFTQWLEILPTDQIVPVPVEYDPATGVMKRGND